MPDGGGLMRPARTARSGFEMGGVLERVTDGVPDHHGRVRLGVLPAVAPVLDDLLGVVPGAPGIGQEHGHQHPGRDGAGQEAGQRTDTETEAHRDRGEEGEQAGGHELPERVPGADVNDPAVLRPHLAGHDPRHLPELAPHLEHDRPGGARHGVDRQAGEQEDGRRPEDHTHQGDRRDHLVGDHRQGGPGGVDRVAQSHDGLPHRIGVRPEERRRGEHRRRDRDPLGDRLGGVAHRIQVGEHLGAGGVDVAGAQVLTDLDAVGNTTKAITKGIAIATAVLAATALFGSYTDAVRQAVVALGDAIDTSGTALAMVSYEVVSPITLVGVILGAATVFLFSGLAIDAVTRAAGAIVFEVRRQFREMPGIMTGEVRPQYGRVVDICTRDSLRELVTPGLLAFFAPIAVGFGVGVGPLAGFLAGAIAAGVLMAVFLANSGGTWDNAKKIVEDGRYGGKNSEAHAAVVIGDTVGDPFKDTAGPAINPLIKVMNLVALLIAPAVVQISLGSQANHGARLVIAITAAGVAFGAVILSRLRAARVDREGRLEHEAHLVQVPAGTPPVYRS